MDMELRVLKYFLMVAREENITKAAQLLHLTQPTLSRQLMQLEEELGVQLFHRGKHNVTLTEDGMLLRRRAQELVSLSEKTKMELQHKEEMPTGEIAIGCGETKSMAALSEKMLPELLQRPSDLPSAHTILSLMIFSYPCLLSLHIPNVLYSFTLFNH